jgi:hypothetical protein
MIRCGRALMIASIARVALLGWVSWCALGWICSIGVVVIELAEECANRNWQERERST